jgi:NAD(P)-dependent dehydrogenase (short-subunit alcohol dehydrogenase family)
VPLDLASFASIRACAAEMLRSFPRLHVLVLNAGISLA